MSRSQLKSLNEFRKRVVGSGYAVTASKLLRYTSNHFATEDDEALDDAPAKQGASEREYFCSELVAKAYKVLGILEDKEKSCTQYFPGCFSPGGAIDQALKEDLFLGPPPNLMVEV